MEERPYITYADFCYLGDLEDDGKVHPLEFDGKSRNHVAQIIVERAAAAMVALSYEMQLNHPGRKYEVRIEVVPYPSPNHRGLRSHRVYAVEPENLLEG